MKKFGIKSGGMGLAYSALALVGLLAGASSAQAQSSVQLYAQVDEWVSAQRFPDGKSAAQLSGGGMSTSYWGLKGSEDLGSSYKAIFALEGFFLPQNGQYGRFNGDTMFSRGAYVGIESPYGTLSAGRQTTPLFVSTILFNPFVDSYEFSPMIWHTYLGLGSFPTYNTDQGVAGYSGWNNSVEYSENEYHALPRTFWFEPDSTFGSIDFTTRWRTFTFIGRTHPYLAPLSAFVLADSALPRGLAY